MSRLQASKRSTRSPMRSRNALWRAGRIALSRGLAVLRIAHGRRSTTCSAHLQRRLKGTTLPIFSRRFEKACTAPCSPLTRNYVQRRALLALADPLLYYSMYGLAVSYIGNGSADRSDAADSGRRGHARDAVARLRARALRRGMELFARRFSQEQRVQSRERRITGISLRVGNTGASSTWGFSTRAADVLRVRGFRIGLAVDVWRQPELLADEQLDPQHMGAGAVATVVRAVAAIPAIAMVGRDSDFGGLQVAGLCAGRAAFGRRGSTCGHRAREVRAASTEAHARRWHTMSPR